MNIQGYLEWRGDVPFSLSPFNEVDSLILSALSYTPFSTVMTEDECLPLEEACTRYFDLHGEQEDKALGFNAASPFLMKKMLLGERFKDIKIAYPYAVLDTVKAVQLRAVSVFLTDDTVYVAYSGTDLSLVGWKEDLFFSCATGTEGQTLASEYLLRHFNETKQTLRIGGHSKGGHFAMYAASQVPFALQEHIVRVYANDAPGFLQDFLSTEGYKNMIPRIVSYIPEESLVGHLMYTEVEPVFCKSTAYALMQHNLYTWEVHPKGFMLSQEKPKEAVKILDKAFKGLLTETAPEERKQLIENIFKWAEDKGYESLNDFKDAPFQSVKDMAWELWHLNSEQQNELGKMLKVLLGEAQGGLLETIKANVSTFFAQTQIETPAILPQSSTPEKEKMN